VHPHLFFEWVAYLFAIACYFLLRRRFGDILSTPTRWTVVVAAVAGGAVGSKILFLLEDPSLTLQNLHNPQYLLGGKTIVGGLIGGLVVVECIKRYAGVQSSTGDLYAIPLALGIAVGRVGCFLTGLSDNTYGNPTRLTWGVDFGDGISRHPTQLYEIVFLVGITPILYLVLRSVSKERRSSQVFLSGDVFKVFMVTYFSFRFLCDFIKPYPKIFVGLQGIQWACLACLLYYSGDVVRWTAFRYRLKNI
jgi:phosphatidylglycerol---prolipoprotein diacylglyceryl transferase